MIFGIIIIILASLGLGYKLGINSMKPKGYNRKDTGNIFMNFHNATEYLEDQYDWYCDMCKDLGKTPLLLEQFKNEIKNNKDLQNEFNKYGINMYGKSNF